jgi:hypothetical protein
MHGKSRGRATPRERVIALLAEEGLEVLDDYISVTQGWYRTAQADCIRWECEVVPREGRDPSNRKRARLFSWDTLTACARRGITVHDPKFAYSVYYDEPDYEVSAKGGK